MAIAYGQVQSINRTTGRSAVAAAAYRSGSRLVDARTGRVCDYSRKGGVVHSEVTVPSGAEWATDRQKLWDAAEAAENRGNATTAREWLGALPHELSDDERAEACREFAGWLAQRHGVAVDWSIHAPDDYPIIGEDARNWHAHMLATSRVVTSSGMGGKTRELDTKGTSSGHIEAWRAEWQSIVNRRLAAAEATDRIDMRSYARQGQHRMGLPKIGPASSAMERRGVKSDAGDRVRAVTHTNARRRAEGRRLVQELKQTREEIMRLSDFNRTQQDRQRTNPWAGKKVPVVGGGGPVDDGRGRRRKREWTPQERQAWKCKRLSDHYDTDLGHLAEMIRQYNVDKDNDEVRIQLQDHTWIRDSGKDGKVYLHGEVTDDSIQAWADVCEAKGWRQMHIHGDDDFKARAWLELRQRGIEVTNYQPAPHIQAQLDAMTATGTPAPEDEAIAPEADGPASESEPVPAYEPAI